MFTFTFHSDVGHGWLEVAMRIVYELGIEVSQYSYMRDNKYFLEEDCDAPRLLKALKAKDIRFKIVTKNVDYESPIRGYDRVL